RGNFFARKGGKLLAVKGEQFPGLLKKMTGLMRDDPEFRKILRRLNSSIDEEKLSPIHKMSYYDTESGLLAVSNGDGMWRRPVGGEWSYHSNGDDGIFFLPGTIDPWQPKFDSNGSDLRWFLEQFRFLNTRRLSHRDQQNFLLQYILHCFFPPLCGSRIIPAFVG